MKREIYAAKALEKAGDELSNDERVALIDVMNSAPVLKLFGRVLLAAQGKEMQILKADFSRPDAMCKQSRNQGFIEGVEFILTELESLTNVEN